MHLDEHPLDIYRCILKTSTVAVTGGGRSDAREKSYVCILQLNLVVNYTEKFHRDLNLV